jgi:predicted dehydrogenase
MEKLGVIIVGAGKIATSAHIPSWLKNQRVKVLALVDLNEEKVKNVCNQFGIKKYYRSLEEALDKEKDAEIVDLATPAKLHYPHAILSLKEGKNVIMEKPMASNSEECKEIIDLAKKNNLKISVFHTFKGYPIVWKIKELVNEGELGDNLFVSFLVSYIDDGLQSWWKGVKTAVIHEFGIHRIYVSAYWLDGIKDVDINVHSKMDDERIKDATVFLYCARGISEITIFKTKREIGDEIRIFGNGKKIVLPPLPACGMQKIEAPQQRDYRKIVIKGFKRLIPPFGMISRGIKYVLFGRKVLPHYIISENFVRSILYNEELIVHPEEGMEAVKTLEKLDELCRDL